MSLGQQHNYLQRQTGTVNALLQRIESILPELDARSEVADQKTHRGTAEGVLEDTREFRIPVWYSGLPRRKIRHGTRDSDKIS
jgi:hypothetical protein